MDTRTCIILSDILFDDIQGYAYLYYTQRHFVWSYTWIRVHVLYSTTFCLIVYMDTRTCIILNNILFDHIQGYTYLYYTQRHFVCSYTGIRVLVLYSATFCLIIYMDTRTCIILSDIFFDHIQGYTYLYYTQRHFVWSYTEIRVLVLYSATFCLIIYDRDMKYCFAQDRYIIYCSIGTCICYTTRVVGAREHENNIMFSLNSIYFQISIYTWQHTSLQIHGNWIGKQVTKNLNKFFSKSIIEM